MRYLIDTLKEAVAIDVTNNMGYSFVILYPVHHNSGIAI